MTVAAVEIHHHWVGYRFYYQFVILSCVPKRDIYLNHAVYWIACQAPPQFFPRRPPVELYILRTPQASRVLVAFHDAIYLACLKNSAFHLIHPRKKKWQEVRLKGVSTLGFSKDLCLAFRTLPYAAELGPDGMNFAWKSPWP